MNSNNSTTSTVTVFSSESCVQCKATYRALDSNNIDYQIVTVTDDIATQLREAGFLQLPVVQTPAHGAWSGFRPDKINELAEMTRQTAGELSHV